MLEILYEDRDIIVVKKPAGIESQSSHSFEPDMVSEIRKVIHRQSTGQAEPYVGGIHRLDRPVSGVMVYAKTKKAAAHLSAQVQDHRMKKTYKAVVCGRIVDNVDNFVDYLLKEPGKNVSKIVEKGISGAKRAELRFRVLNTVECAPKWPDIGPLALVQIELLTGRHHQIRVQFAGHGLPLWGDSRYNPMFSGIAVKQLALCASRLEFIHPISGKTMVFSIEPEGEIFHIF